MLFHNGEQFPNFLRTLPLLFLNGTVYAHTIRGQDDEAARKWEEFQKR